MSKVEKKEVKKEVEAKIEAPKSNEELLRVGQEVKLEKVAFLVKQIKGIDVILSRKDYK